MIHGTHNALDDPRNQEVKIYVSGELLPRNEAKISVLIAVISSVTESGKGFDFITEIWSLSMITWTGSGKEPRLSE